MKNIHHAWFILMGCCALTCGLGLTINCAGQYLTSVANDLGVGMGQISMYLTVQGICTAIAAPFVGKLLPKMNIRFLLTFCYSLCVVSIAAMGMFTKVWQWYIAGAVFGFSCAFCFLIPTPIIVGNWFMKKTGFAVGIAMAFSGVSGAIMNPVIAALIETVGWRNTYFINAIVAAVVVLPATLFILTFKPSDKGLQPYGYEDDGEGNNAPASPGKGVSAKDAVRSPAFYCMFLIFGLIAYTSCYVQQLAPFATSIGLAAAIGGTMASMSMIGNIAGKLSLGAINDRWGVKIMTLVGMGSIFLAFILLIVGGSSVTLILFATFLCGISLSMTSVGSPLLARALFGSRDFSTVFSSLSIGQNIFSALGVTIVGFIYDATGSYVPAFAIGGTAALAVVVLTFAAFVFGKKLAWD